MQNSNSTYDVVIIGGGPAGLSGALALGRARKRVLVCDFGARRNAAATHMNNFVSRDGTPPDEFRRISREQLKKYPNVELLDTRVESIDGERGAFEIHLAEGVVEARRILLCTGMVDEPPPIEGMDSLWGHAVFQCPYCHGWEVQDKRWGFLPSPQHASHLLPFALMIRGWTKSVTVFTNQALELPPDTQAQLKSAGIQIESSPIARFIGREQELVAVELQDGSKIPCDALFTHPAQRQVGLVKQLGLALDNDGFVQVDPMKRETSIPGIYASGDLTTRMQAAIAAATSGMQAAAMINVELTMDLVAKGQI